MFLVQIAFAIISVLILLLCLAKTVWKTLGGLISPYITCIICWHFLQCHMELFANCRCSVTSLKQNLTGMFLTCLLLRRRC